MRKKITISFLVCFSTACSFLFAQNITVSGKVTDASGMTLPSVNIQVKGTNTGTSTDFDGKYEISAPKGGILIFSYLGFKTQEIKISDSTLNVSLEEDAASLDEVVVTALGISREKKSLGYAIQEVDGDAINKGSESNVVNTLSGKIAGVQIQGTNNIGGSSRILLRGASSLTGNNQPLFVVDGVPIDNSNFGSGTQAYGGRDDINGNVDYGNAAQDINPDDVASISVLKGANAAALYGSRAANGVILITTKKGKKRNGLGVDVNYGFSLESAYDFPGLQNEYGGGQSLDFANIGDDGIPIQNVSTDESWGPKLDGRLVRQWDGDGNGGEVRPWVAHPDNYKDFFNTGEIHKTNIAVSNGGEFGNYRVSYTNLNHDGIIPNSNINRNTFNINLNGKINKLSISTNFNYINTKGTARPKLGGSSDNLTYNMVIWSQRQLDIDRLRDYKRADGTQRTWRTGDLSSTSIRANNPFWLAYEDYQDDEKNRFIGNINVKYDITNELSATLKYGFDRYDDRRRDRRAVGSRYTPYFISKMYNFSEENIDALLQYNNPNLTEDISLIANLGANKMTRTLESNSGATQGGLTVNNIYSLANSVDAPYLSRGLSNKETNSIYASTSLGYKDYLYLDLTARNDWSSTLPKDNWSYFYPSVTGSVLFSEFIESEKINLGKFRVGWAQVGNDTDPYRLNNDYVQGAAVGGNPVFYLPSTLNNSELKPEITNSFETGVELKMYQNRLGLDLTYYTGNTKNQIMPITVSETTGYSSKWVNAGEIKNSGIEVLLTGTPIKTEDFSWNVGVNWAKNNNEVVELAEGLDSYLMSTFYTSGPAIVTLESRVGEPFSSVYATKIARDPDGNKIVDANGYYVSGEQEFIGSVLPDWTSGITNTISYKNFTLSALIDIQKGGVYYARGYQTAIYAGTIDITAANGVRENGLVADGVMSDGNGGYVTNTTPVASVDQYFRLMRRNPGDFTTFDASFVKLREMSLQYSFSSEVLEKLSLSALNISLVGRNLAILSRNTPDGYDPESAGNASGNIQGREYGQLPTARTVGMNIKLSF
ncbi:SusC/RagA family TonB-linked outer membrane protein [Aureibaculum sp. A20]|uniref:SusC/RagA family TonB-linked outer membrane protein n=1 Tax=Aureibaculum flavum TaxID=2795986 RepID=A0ABS0WPD0_9FLAO|nr:SusC/RagA family TonB-linked outer membrane protein [Aureibaculum flavum]MBJ2173848.1 SusC/RagA family TonB-linked outer membrane protein [Aureibaculum flavum]